MIAYSYRDRRPDAHGRRNGLVSFHVGRRHVSGNLFDVVTWSVGWEKRTDLYSRAVWDWVGWVRLGPSGMGVQLKPPD